MPNFIAKRWSVGRSSIGRSPHPACPAPDLAPASTGERPRPRAASQDGFLLIEVIVSALLVGIIVVATFTGFDVLGRASADQRAHNEAALLAAQSQEQLRSEPGSALEALVVKANTYTKTANGTVYTITQSAEHVNGSGQVTGCAVTEPTASTAPNLRITSSVRWPALASSRAPVAQSSVITPPTGSSLEVDVISNEAGTSGVAGVTAVIKYTPVESGSTVTREATTGPAGCVLFGSIRATAVTLEIVEKPNFVTPTGALKVSPVEVTIAPNLTTHHQVLYNEGGAIEAQFTYKNETTFNGKPVTGDTFVAYNEKFATLPRLQIGATQFGYEAGGEEHYTAVTGGTVVGGVAVPYAPPSAAKTATGAKYLHGDLFPFPAQWVVYAGDCGENNAASITKEAVKNGKGTVTAGATTVVKIPMSYMTLNVWTGYSEKNKGTLTAELLPVKITNTECASAATPNNAVGSTYIHFQSLAEGHLGNPFQPFGKFALCVASPSLKHTYAPPAYANSTEGGSSANIYLGQHTEAERTEQKTAEAAAETKREGEETAAKPAKEKREKEETEAKTAKEKREKEETEAKTAKTKREGEEATAKTAKEKREKEETEQKTAKTKREGEEKTLREKWKKEETEGKIKLKAREEKETKQTTERKTAETNENTAKTKREGEEATAKTAKEKREGEETAATAARTAREAAETAAKTAKTTRESEEAAAKPAKEKREKERTEAKTAKEKREKEESEEAANKITVESKAEC
jgi:Tfp pilus assembly protein PilV